MLDLLRANPDHPFHAYAAARDQLEESRRFTGRVRETLLAQHRGAVRAVRWELTLGMTNDELVVAITLELGDGRALELGNTALLEQLARDDWAGVVLAGRAFAPSVWAHQDAMDLDPREAALDVLGALLQMPAENVESFCWLVDQLVYDEYSAGSHVLYLTTTELKDDRHDR